MDRQGDKPITLQFSEVILPYTPSYKFSEDVKPAAQPNWKHDKQLMRALSQQ